VHDIGFASTVARFKWGAAMKYDPSKQALFHPEQQDPVEDFNVGWPLDAICAELSRLAYYHFEAGDLPRLEAALTRAGFGPPEPFNGTRTDAQAFGTIGRAGTLFVAFRGTQPDRLKDFLTDAEFRRVAWSGVGDVHRGFLAAFSDVQAQIEAWLGNAGAGPLVSTGHSLGAAMATIMAASEARTELVTFGSPLVGNRTFADQFARRAVRRYVDCTDMVATIPPALIGYAHVQGLRYIDRGGAVYPAPPGAAAVALDQAEAVLTYEGIFALDPLHNVPERNLADHAPINYISALLGRREMR
jgi:hypothetical protein